MTTVHAHPGLRRVRDGYWRVVAPSGILLGYVEELPSADGPRFSAGRLLPRTTRVVPVGEFSSALDAVECLR
ncbi:hypothetical protein N1031_08510 [Herbiconiux moechotypicola]|nr:hypothetical protein [Herbiconiux moechotypicola]MCS5729800.1 hypothetical protein [Herbiconiux moechotypicola]